MKGIVKNERGERPLTILKRVRIWIVRLFFLLTPMFLYPNYPDVTGFYPFCIWACIWAGVYLIVFTMDRILSTIDIKPLSQKKEPKIRIPSGWLNKLFRLLGVVFISIFFIMIVSREIMYAGLVYLMSPISLVLFGVAAILVNLRRRVRHLFPFYATVTFIWFCIIYALLYARIPSSVRTCGSLDLPEGVRAILPIEKIREYPPLDGSYPYEARIDDGSLFVTFKNLQGQGAIARFFLDGREPIIIKTENETYSWATMYPERMCIDKQNKVLYSTTKTMEFFEIIRVDYSEEGFVELDPIEIPDHEPTNCLWDEGSGTLIVLFLEPGVHVQMYRFPEGPRGKAIEYGTRIDRPPGFLTYTDYMVLDQNRGRAIVAAGWLPDNFLLSIDVESGEVKEIPLCRSWWLTCMNPLGIDLDSTTDRIYLSDPIHSRVIMIDGNDNHQIATQDVSRFPRRIAVASEEGRLFVGAYSGRSVNELRLDDLKPLRSYEIGRLVRSVYHDRETGIALATSTCGVFAIHSTPHGIEK